MEIPWCLVFSPQQKTINNKKHMIKLQKQEYNQFGSECLDIEKSRIMPGFLLGQQGSLAGIDAAFQAGVTDVEIVLPHYDQKMDGSTIRSASDRIFIESILPTPAEMIKNLGEYLKIYRSEYLPGYQISYLHLMSYFQGIIKGRYKTKKIQDFVSACSKSRISNLIIPDIPDDPDGDLFINLAKENKISITRIISPQNYRQAIPLVQNSDTIYYIPRSGKTGGKLALDPIVTNRLKFTDNRLPNCHQLIGFGVTPEIVPQLQDLNYTPVFCSPMVAELTRVRESLTTDNPQEIYNQYYKAARNLINQYANIKSN
jgi:tryptophan synthase alpha subunit